MESENRVMKNKRVGRPLSADLRTDSYDAGRLFDWVKERFEIANDEELSVMIGRDRSLFQHMRSGRVSISSGLLLDLYDKFGIEIDKLREIAGMRSRFE